MGQPHQKCKTCLCYKSVTTKHPTEPDTQVISHKCSLIEDKPVVVYHRDQVSGQIEPIYERDCPSQLQHPLPTSGSAMDRYEYPEQAHTL